MDGEQQVGDDEDGHEAKYCAVVVLGRDERGSVLEKRKKKPLKNDEYKRLRLVLVSILKNY